MATEGKDMTTHPHYTGDAKGGELTAEQYAILHHTKYRAAQRRYCGTSDAMCQLVERRLMRSCGKVAWCPDEYFAMTEAGRIALAAAERTRYARR